MLIVELLGLHPLIVPSIPAEMSDIDVEHGQEQQKQQEEMAQYAEQLRARKEAEAGGERVQTTAERMAAEQAQREEGGAVGKLEGQVRSPHNGPARRALGAQLVAQPAEIAPRERRRLEARPLELDL